MAGELSEGRQHRTQPASSAAGFTLLEALAVITVVAILLGAAAPHAAGVLAGLHLRTGAVRLAAALVRGRIAALREGRAWVLEAGDRDFVLGPEGDPGERERFPERVHLRAATSQGDVRFAPDGTAENATFTLAIGDRERRVVINQRGRVYLD